MNAPPLRYRPDHDTRAARPAEAVLSRRAYAAYFGDTLRERWLRRLACRMPDALGRLAPFRSAWEHWAQMRMVLREGCLNAARVLDAAAGRVAVYTDLSNHPRRPKPVVRIFDERLHLIRPTPPASGARIAAVCVYWRQPDRSADADWDDVSAIVLDCLVDNWVVRQAALDLIPDHDWHALDEVLARLSGEPAPGLYEM
jgi:hypothetical protein